MSEVLRSVGLDVGTTSTQMILSELTVENRASGFAVPEMEIVDRKICYKSPVHFTPLLDDSHVDGEALRRLVEREYQAAGITRESVDTGAVIITGETSRKENAGTVLEVLSDLAGDFVVATAGPDLESILAAKGAGADVRSRDSGRPIVHMDIGGGTSNLALIQDGKILQTTCLNVGGRLIKFDECGVIRYISPVLKGMWSGNLGDRAAPEMLREVAQSLVQALEMAVGLRPVTKLLEDFTTKELTSCWKIPSGVMVSFSGGVADCIEKEHPWHTFGDLGPILGRAIRESRLCAGEYVLGRETIRATVIGAGCHSAQLSGSTVFQQNVTYPLKNVPVVFPGPTADSIRRGLATQEGSAMMSLAGVESPSYRQVAALAEEILQGTEGPILVCLEQDMAKALGQALAVRSEPGRQILCIDRIRIPEGSYLDVGAPVGPAMPVVVKTLILSK